MIFRAYDNHSFPLFYYYLNSTWTYLYFFLNFLQVFQEELRDHSMISTILGVDVSDPDITQGTQQQVKSLSDRWSKVWNWSEQRKAQLLKVCVAEDN